MMLGIACYYTGRHADSVEYMESAISEKPQKTKWKDYYNKIISLINKAEKD